MNFSRISTSFTFIAFILVSASATLAADLSTTKPKNVGISSERLEYLDSTLQNFVDDDQLAGSVLLIARNDKIAYLKAFGFRDRESDSAMTTDTIFRIASQTKAIVSLGIMILQEEGRLIISDPVGKYIPEFMNTTVAESQDDGTYKIVKAKRPITVRDLLTHTSGISYGDGIARDLWNKAGIQGWYFADRDEPIGATVRRMAALPFDAQPGERWIYGYNIDVLGVVIEQASGESLDAFLKNRIFVPLGMNDTHFYLPPAKINRLATVYNDSEDSHLTRAPAPGTTDSQGAYVEGPRKSFSGGAGLLSTAKDYASFLQMMLNGGEFNGKRIISRKSVELMTVDHLGNMEFRPGEGFGLGFSITKDLGERGLLGSVGEFGWGGAYLSTYWADPAERLVVVFLTQLRPGLHWEIHTKLRALIYQALENKNNRK